ncbi:MAG: class I SAM-dependent RNA methyltransferase [Candidatus Sericytochromatia bacterium]
MDKLDLIATAAFGLESEVAYELKKLGYEDLHVEGGRVTFRGDALAVARANMWLRVADRVQIRLGEFRASTFDELYDQTKALPWSEILPEDACFPVDGKSVKSTLTSVPAVQKITKKAIVDHMAERYGRAMSPETGATHRVQVALLNDVATLTLDTSGDGLHKRGYRPLVAAAPIKETLAAGLVMLSRWRPGRPFADPMCGSGTIPIEAAMQGLNMAPGKLRHFEAEKWPAIPASVWREARQEAVASERRDLEIDIVGSDIDPENLALARHHAERAGLSRFIRFEERPVSEFRPSGPYGVLLTNPPYGERLEDEPAVERLYREMGQAFLPHETWSFFVITRFDRFEHFFGKKAAKKRKLYNGRLKVDLYQYHGPRPPRVIT